MFSESVNIVVKENCFKVGLPYKKNFSIRKVSGTLRSVVEKKDMKE
jgi:hypothetical protein